MSNAILLQYFHNGISSEILEKKGGCYRKTKQNYISGKI